MKNDPTFKLVAAIILTGVIVAFASPSPTHVSAGQTEVEVAAPAATE